MDPEIYLKLILMFIIRYQVIGSFISCLILSCRMSLYFSGYRPGRLQRVKLACLGLQSIQLPCSRLSARVGLRHDIKIFRNFGFKHFCWNVCHSEDASRLKRRRRWLREHVRSSNGHGVTAPLDRQLHNSSIININAWQTMAVCLPRRTLPGHHAAKKLSLVVLKLPLSS